MRQEQRRVWHPRSFHSHLQLCHKRKKHLQSEARCHEFYKWRCGLRVQLCNPGPQHETEQVKHRKEGVFRYSHSVITVQPCEMHMMCPGVKTSEISVDNGSICYRSYLAHYKVGLGGEVMGSGQLTKLPCFSAPALS